MRARNIKPGFFKNEELAELEIEARILFIGLWLMADREGRLEDRPKRVKVEVFPYDNVKVDVLLDKLKEKNFIQRYEVDSRKYIQIFNFTKHQDPHYKEALSVIPPPDGHHDSQYIVSGLSEAQKREVYEEQGRICVECGATQKLSIDHKKPRSIGGTNEKENLQVLCIACNTRKRNKFDASSVQIQANVTASSVECHPSDSLIPDSLIPDSLIPERRPDVKGTDGFSKFWEAYPRKVGKLDAQRVWKRRGVPRIEIILEAITRQRSSTQWTRDGGRFIPNPATWLNQGRWDDAQEAAEPGTVPKCYREAEPVDKRDEKVWMGPVPEEFKRAVEKIGKI